MKFVNNVFDFMFAVYRKSDPERDKAISKEEYSCMCQIIPPYTLDKTVAFCQVYRNQTSTDACHDWVQKNERRQMRWTWFRLRYWEPLVFHDRLLPSCFNIIVKLARQMTDSRVENHVSQHQERAGSSEYNICGIGYLRYLPVNEWVDTQWRCDCVMHV